MLYDSGDGGQLNQTSLAQYSCPAAHRRYFTEVVRGQQYRCACFRSFANQIQDNLSYKWVESDGWFIEDEQVRLVLKCVDNPNFLTVALLQGTHPSVQIQVESLGQLLLSLVYVVTVA